MKWLYFPFQDISADPSMPSNQKRYEQKYDAQLTVVKYPARLDGVGIDDMFIVAGHGLPGDERIGISVPDENVSWQEKAARWASSRPPATKQITIQANDLAEMLDRADLDKAHKRIKLITCGGAGMAVLDEKNVTFDPNVLPSQRSYSRNATNAPFASANVADCFASVFAKAMRLRLYIQLRVRGYPGFVSAGIGSDGSLQKFMSVETSSGKGNALEGEVWDGTWFSKKPYWGKKAAQIKTKGAEKFWFDGQGNRVN